MIDIEKLKAWMKREGHNRAWLADAIGAKPRSLDNYFSAGSFPDWAEKHILRIMQHERELRFTEREFDLIEQARTLAGYKNRQLFFLDAINTYARKILEEKPIPFPEEKLRVADDVEPYITKSKGKPA